MKSRLSGEERCAITIVALSLLVLAGVARGEEVEVGGKVKEVRALIEPWQFMLVPLSVVMVMLAKKWLVRVPSEWWPWVVPFIGAGLDWLGANAGMWTGNSVVGGMMGGLAVWFHQTVKQTSAYAERKAEERDEECGSGL